MRSEQEHNSSVPVRRRSRSVWRYWPVWAGLVGLVIGLGYVWSARAGAAAAARAPQGPRPVPVTAVAATTADLPVRLTGLGTVTPLQAVTVRTRVDGQLLHVFFQEGQLVKAGEPLAEIDPRPLEALLTQAEGQLARDQAVLTNGQLDLQRYESLYRDGGIPKQQLDTQAALIRQYEGVIRSDEGQVENAKVQLAYCHIAAPISGRVGLRLVDPGNIVHAADPNGLVVITQLEPIGVLFTIPEDSLPSVLARLKAGEHLSVEAYDRADQHRLAVGSLLTLDNQIDPTTGSVRLKATFPNTETALFPNQFVNARLTLGVERGATVVPAAAVQRSPQGSFVYVVNADRTAAMRTVKVGLTEGDQAAIAQGIQPGEMVVVDGADRLREGATVEVRAPAATPAPGAKA